VATWSATTTESSFILKVYPHRHHPTQSLQLPL